MYSSTLQQFQYTSVLELPKADGALFLKNSSISGKVWQHMGPLRKLIGRKRWGLLKSKQKNKQENSTSPIQTFVLQNR